MRNVNQLKQKEVHSTVYFDNIRTNLIETDYIGGVGEKLVGPFQKCQQTQVKENF